MLRFIRNLFAPSQIDAEFNKIVATNRATMQATAKAEKCNMVEQFIDTNGDVYYSFASIDTFNVQRWIMSESLRLQIAYSLSPAYLQTAAKELQKGLDALESGDVQPLVKSAFDHVQRINNNTLDGSLFVKLAALYLIRHDENPTFHDETIYQQKIQRAQRSYALKDFFLKCVYESTLHTQNYYLVEKFKKLGINSIVDLKNFLND